MKQITGWALKNHLPFNVSSLPLVWTADTSCRFYLLVFVIMQSRLLIVICDPGDLNENFCIGPIRKEGSQNDANQWPSEGNSPTSLFRCFRFFKKINKLFLWVQRTSHVGRRQWSYTMKLHCKLSFCPSQQRKFNSCNAIYNNQSLIDSLHQHCVCVILLYNYLSQIWIFLFIRTSSRATGKRILSLIALSLNLDAEFFDCPVAFLRLLHYPGNRSASPFIIWN